MQPVATPRFVPGHAFRHAEGAAKSSRLQALHLDDRPSQYVI